MCLACVSAFLKGRGRKGQKSKHLPAQLSKATLALLTPDWLDHERRLGSGTYSLKLYCAKHRVDMLRTARAEAG